MDNEGLFIQKGFSLKNKQASKQTKTLAPASYQRKHILQEIGHIQNQKRTELGRSSHP